MTIVVGLDQHRAQITAEWLDTATGEIGRSRVRPADRAGVRAFLGRFGGVELEVALEATTGWRFVVEELRRVGAVVHLAEPAETAARRGNKKRAKNDRADARHLRARVRLRHTLSEQRGEWQQRIQAVLYHHGCPQRRNLMTAEGQRWLAAQPLPACAREQVTVALSMIAAVDAQLVPLTRELRAYARRQPGCRALMGHYGIGELIAVTILAELGDARRFSSSREAVRYAGMDITVKQSDKRRAPGHLSRQGPPALRWALYEAAQSARRHSSPDRDYYLQAAERLGGNRARLAVARKAAQAQLPHPARTRRPGPATRLTLGLRAQPPRNPMYRGRLPASSCRHARVDGLQRPSGRKASPSGITPSTITSPARHTPGSWTEIRLGARAPHNTPKP